MRIIWNPNSGRKGGIPTNRASRDSLLELMDSHDLGEELRETESEADAIEATRDAVERGYDIVVAAGGDGTVRLVAKELLGTRSALGILPLGSVMNVARMVGLPRDLEESARILRQGHVRRIDVGLVGDRVFLEAASVGLHAAISRDIQRVDEGDYSAVLRSMVTAFRYRPSRMTIELDDGRTIDRRALLVAVTIGPFLGAGFTVAPEAAIDDGLFDVRAFLHYSKRELILNFASIAFGRRAYVPHALTERASRVRISSHTSLPARADGEDLGTTPVLFEIRPGWLRVVAPEDPVASG
jgi:diacylglycerol kinase (ATP)